MKSIPLNVENSIHSLVFQKMVLTAQVEALKVALLQIVSVTQGEIAEIQIKAILESSFKEIREKQLETFLLKHDIPENEKDIWIDVLNTL